jgi:hypothetical protein
MNGHSKKRCLICTKEYEPKESQTGQEQKYCSATCRNKAAYQRRESNILAKFKGTIQSESNHRDDGRYIQGYNLNYADLGTSKIIEMIQDAAELRAENKRLQDKVQQLEMDKAELISELEEMPEENNMAGIGKMITDYAPVILTMLNNRTNAQQTTPTS